MKKKTPVVSSYRGFPLTSTATSICFAVEPKETFLGSTDGTISGTNSHDDHKLWPTNISNKTIIISMVSVDPIKSILVVNCMISAFSF